MTSAIHQIGGERASNAVKEHQLGGMRGQSLTRAMTQNIVAHHHGMSLATAGDTIGKDGSIDAIHG